AVVGLLSAAPLRAATTFNVPADKPTIQSAINAASNGDTILVAPGSYSGHGNTDIDFGGKAVTVVSSDGVASTIIDLTGADAAHPARAFRFHASETSASIVRGFTIRNGFEDSGGGIQ